MRSGKYKVKIAKLSLRLKRSSLLKNQYGMSLPGTLMAVAISGVIMFAMITALHTSYKNYRNLNQLNEFMQTVNEASTLLKNNLGDQCTANVSSAINLVKASGKNVNLNNINNPDPIPFSVNYYNPDGSVGQSLLAPTAPDQSLRGVKYTSISLAPKARLNTETIALEVEVIGEKTGDVVSGTGLKQNFVIFARVDAAGNFLSCGNSDSELKDRLCRLNSDGLARYNPTTEKCEAPKLEVRCFDGNNPFQASCPGGSKVTKQSWNKCKTTMEEPPGWDISKISKNYKKHNGNTKSKDTKPTHFICEESSDSTSVECIYEETINVASNVKCRVCCEVGAL